MKRIHRSLLILGFLPLALCAQAGPYRIHYLVEPVLGPSARLHVVLHVSGVSGARSVRFQMPVWSPGDYHVMNHGKYVRDVHATSAPDHPNRVTHPDQNTWEVQTDGFDAVVLVYSVPNVPAGYFSENAKVTDQYAFYNGPAVYMYVVGHKEDPAALQINLPRGWNDAITPLDPLPQKDQSQSIRQFSAPDYDTLADSPVVIGDYVAREFIVAGRPHTIVFFNDHEGMDYDSFAPVIQPIVAEENRLMGGPTYKRYIFFFDVGGRGGGLEHLNSTRIGWWKGGSARFLPSMVAHEFFHLWNVKRIRPAVLGPFDYIDPPKTRNLWFCEGVTSYYGDLSAHRAGISGQEEYLRRLAGSIASLQRNPARKRLTADESSLRVWESNNSDGYGGLSYYLKGELIGLCLDLKIRGITGSRAGLDDVMRDLLVRYGLPKPGFQEDGIRDAVIRAGGQEMGPFYDLLARSTEEMPFAECLRYAGLRLMQDSEGRVSLLVDSAASAQSKSIRSAWLTGRSTPTQQTLSSSRSLRSIPTSIRFARN